LPTTIEMVSQIGPDLPLVLADSTQIHQVLMNLCTNAAHALRGRFGRLEVRLESFQVDEDFSRLHPDLHPGPHLKLMVSDTGHGMDPETMNRIFLPFFTTKGPGEGTGLGLAVVHGIVKDHQGAIFVSSRPGEGTVFDLYFPAIEADEGQEEEVPEQAILGHGERILLVDDEPTLCRVGVSVMNRLGYRATAQSNPRIALEMFQKQPHEFDLVLTDLTMPGMTGIVFAARVLKTRPEIPVLLTTGAFTSETMAEAQSLGIRDLIMKPFNQAQLGEALNKALKSKGAGQAADF
jgi:CheY-like chemotaxis protein